jgi:hypothetical protein
VLLAEEQKLHYDYLSLSRQTVALPLYRPSKGKQLQWQQQ